ncbi:MAG: hypothetical protein WCA93_09495 [Acidimicrobiia bacterium]
MLISPRQVGEVLGEGMRVLSVVWRKLIPPAFWTYVVLGAATILTFALTGADEFIDLVISNPAALEQYTAEELYEPTMRFLLAVFIVLALNAIATAFLSVAVHRLVGSELAHSPVGPRDASTFALGNLPRSFLAIVVTGLAVFAGLVLFILPGVWLAISLSMITPVIALEHAGPLVAMRRSFSLVRGRWWQTLGFLLMVALMGTVAAQLVQLVALPALSAGDVSLVVGLAFVFLILIEGFISAAILVMLTIWYIDLRARSEQLFTTSLS